MRPSNQNIKPKISFSDKQIPDRGTIGGSTISTDQLTQLLEQEISKAIQDKGYTSEDLDNLLNSES